MPRITELFAFIAEDEGPEDEGVTAFLSSVGWTPMVAADRERVDSLREKAQAIASATSKQVRLVRFSVREELEVFEPLEAEHAGN
jgi:hypothetical protein